MKMIKSVVFIILLFTNLTVWGQDKVDWTYTYNPVDHQILIHAEIADGWHLYSQHIANEIGPVPTSFEFKEDPNIVFVDEVQEPESIKEYDPNFEGDLNFFKHQVTFIQNVKVLSPTTAVGTVTFMVCNDTMCLPPVDEIFQIELQ